MTPWRIANKLRGKCSYHTPITVVLTTKKLSISSCQRLWHSVARWLQLPPTYVILGWLIYFMSGKCHAGLPDGCCIAHSIYQQRLTDLLTFRECDTVLPDGSSCPSLEYCTYPDPDDCTSFWQCYNGCPEHMAVRYSAVSTTVVVEPKFQIPKFEMSKISWHTVSLNKNLTWPIS
jgi:hypothetical protein